jgi:hypothetical protein
MVNKGYFSKEERVARSRAAKLVHRGTFIYGSIVTSERKCGKAGCWCQKKSGGHVSSYLSVKIGDERKLIFIPQDMLKKAQAWVKAYRELEQDIITISGSCVAHLKQGR